MILQLQTWASVLFYWTFDEKVCFLSDFVIRISDFRQTWGISSVG